MSSSADYGSLPSDAHAKCEEEDGTHELPTPFRCSANMEKDEDRRTSIREYAEIYSEMWWLTHCQTESGIYSAIRSTERPMLRESRI